MNKYITTGDNKTEKKLLKKFAFLQAITRGDGKTIVGYRCYGKGLFGFPSFRQYHWL